MALHVYVDHNLCKSITSYCNYSYRNSYIFLKINQFHKIFYLVSKHLIHNIPVAQQVCTNCKTGKCLIRCRIIASFLQEGYNCICDNIVIYEGNSIRKLQIVI